MPNLTSKRIHHTLHLRAPAYWLVALSMTVGSGLTRPANLAAAPSPGPAVAEQSGGTPPSCLGADDLLVSGETIAMSDMEVLDHLCVTNKGRIVGTGNLSLTVGILYVDSSSAISMDGRAGGIESTHDCLGNGGGPNGSAGYSLAIAAYQITIDGSLSADGGRGIPTTLNCSTLIDAGNGGDGGFISLSARHLAIAGLLSARGGAGGAGGAATVPAYASTLGPSRKPSGDGGNGGHITLRAPAADPASLHGTLDAQAGSAGKPGNGGRGRAGRVGTVRLVPLSQATSAAPAPAPASLLTLATDAPAIHALSASSTENLPCGSGDLVVPAGTTRILSGVQQFNHVCISGTVRGMSDLTLVAQTITIAGTGAISLDGRSPLPFLWSDSGRYGKGGACTDDHGAAHAGVRGPVTGRGNAVSADLPDLAARSGEGGGRLTLIADTLAIQGQVQANGGAGQAAFAVATIDGAETWAGSGGGSGGGITIYTHRLALDGRISAIGGAGGKGSGPGHVDGAHGSGGCVKVLADQIDAAQPAPAIVGSAFVDALGPADPIPPPVQPDSRIYFAATHHTLAEPFLSYWRAHGGLAMLGYPLTEAFSEHGILEQYTERALLTVVGGSVRTVALGTALTAARHFPRVAQAAAGARFFAATGHLYQGHYIASMNAGCRRPLLRRHRP